MRPALSPRVQAVLVLALVATLGALIGILGDRFIATQRADAALPGMERSRIPMASGARYGEGLTMSLNLTAAQRTQIDSILAEERVRARALTMQFQPQFRALASETRERVEAVLTSEQREELRALRQQRMRGRRDMRPGDMLPGDMLPRDMRPGDTRPGEM